MEVGNKDINTLSFTTKPKNPYEEILEFLKSWHKETLSLEELKAEGVNPVIRATIKSWLMDGKVKDEKLLDFPKEEWGKYPIKVELLIKVAEEETFRWNLEHSNNLYIKYKLLLEEGYEPKPLRVKASWCEFSQLAKTYTLSYYVMEALKRDKDFMALASIKKPPTFYYRDGGEHSIQQNGL